MQRTDPNNPNSGRMIPGSPAAYDFYAGSPYAGAVLLSGPGIAQRYRLPDGRIVSGAEIQGYQRTKAVDRGPELYAALNRLAGLNSTRPMIGQLPTSSIQEIDRAYGYRDPLTRAPSTSKPSVPYGGTGMAPVAKVISSLGRSVAAPFSTAFSGKKINVGTGGAPMVNVFRSLFGK